LGKKIKNKLIAIGFISLIVLALIPIELVPGFLIHRYEWSKLFIFLFVFSIETGYIYGNYYAGLWLLNIIVSKTVYQRAVHGRLIQWFIRRVRNFDTATHSDRWVTRTFTKVLMFLAGGSYVLFLNLTGFLPQAMKPGLAACVVRKRVEDCKYIVIGTFFKLIICTWWGEEIYSGIFGFPSLIYGFGKNLLS